MEKDKMKVAIYSIHSDYKKLSTDFEKLDRIYVPLNDAYNDIFIRSKK